MVAEDAGWVGNLINVIVYCIIAYFVHPIGALLYLIDFDRTDESFRNFAIQTMTGFDLTPLPVGPPDGLKSFGPF